MDYNPWDYHLWIPKKIMLPYIYIYIHDENFKPVIDFCHFHHDFFLDPSDGGIRSQENHDEFIQPS